MDLSHLDLVRGNVGWVCKLEHIFYVAYPQDHFLERVSCISLIIMTLNEGAVKILKRYSHSYSADLVDFFSLYLIVKV